MKGRQSLRVLAYVSGLINQEFLLHVEYLAAENRILRAHLPNRLRLTRDERSSLGEIGKRVGRKGLEKRLRWLDPKPSLTGFENWLLSSSTAPSSACIPGRPAISPALAILIVNLARRTPAGVTDSISGVLANRGHNGSDQTVGDVLRRHGIAPAPKRSQTITWKDFIASHMVVQTGDGRPTEGPTGTPV